MFKEFNIEALVEASDMEKKIADKVINAFKGMSKDEQAKFMKSYLKNPDAAVGYMFSNMQKMAMKEEKELDPVNPKALKGKFKDREDKDIDNDGDTDSSDEYLHKRRSAVSKAIGKMKEAVELDEAKLSASQRDRLDDLILNVHMTTHPEYDGDEGPKKYLDMIRKEFGDKVAKQVDDGIEKVHWGRDNQSGGNDKLSWRKGNARITKSGKMNAQDVNALKNRIKRDKAWGGITKAVKLPESVELDEAKNNLVARYMNKSGSNTLYVEIYEKPNGDYTHTITNQRGINMSASSIDLKSSHADAKKNVNKVTRYYDQDGDAGALRFLNGLLPGWKKAPMNEAVELDELSAVTLGKYSQKARTDALDHSGGPWGKKKDPARVAKRLSGDAMAVKKLNKIRKEAVELDEISRDLARSYIRKAASTGNRKKGVEMAGKKAYSIGGEPKVRATEAKDSYTINHKTFSSAVQHAEEVVNKRGFEVDPEEWDRKVSMGPRKPGAGKTNSYTIALMKNGKEVKQKLQMQVYYDEGRYELNMYIS